MASVGHLSEEKKLDVRILHGDGTNTVAKKGERGLATLVTSTRRGRKSSPLLGAALGRVAMRAKLVTSGKADVS
jgi:hypothetical protein